MGQNIKMRWLAQMAWRDSRRNRGRLLLFISSIILGIAALVAIDSLGDNLREEIDRQAATLIGADLEISSNKEPTPVVMHLVDSIGDRRSEERRFNSMIYFPENDATRLVEVRAIEGEFPYYGDLDTEPAGAARSFRSSREALVDQTLMLQYNAGVGDSIRLGYLNFRIAGILVGAPGQTGISSSISPLVYIPMRFLESTGLDQKGSRMNFRYYFKYDRPVDMDALIKNIEPRLEIEGVNYDTIETEKQNTARSFADLTRFLSLVGFIALLLGCIGVASAIHIYIREKIPTIAILRCLGATSRQAFQIYLIQILVIGFIGSVAGAFLGTLVQQFLPAILQDFLPVKITTFLSWRAIIQGIILGVVIALLFALVPLVGTRNISPLNTLRISFETARMKGDPLRWLVYLLIAGFVLVFSYLQLQNWNEAFIFTQGVIVAFLVLAALAAFLTWFVRRFFPARWNFLWRQGLANLYRPNNQTRILVVSIGLGTALICTLFFIQGILLARVTMFSSGNQPNMLLFDIQTPQREGMAQLAQEYGLDVMDMVPIVNMRLESVRNITPQKLQQDSTIRMQRWIFSREFRVTYRDSLTETEKITKGKWFNGVVQPGERIEISLEERFANRNNIRIGDTMVFNVQGTVIPVVAGSFREVNWNRVQTNFIIVFPRGVIEEAPQFHVMLTHMPSAERSAAFQQAVVRRFPNVSIIDLALILKVVDDLLEKIGFVIRFMAAFSIITGLVVLIASVLISKYQRIQESVLLRTLGAVRRQILIITALEYFFLGALAAATGIVIALVGSWALAYFTFETPFSFSPLPVVIVFISVCMLTVLTGLLNSRSVLTRPPLEILRQEV